MFRGGHTMYIHLIAFARFDNGKEYGYDFSATESDSELISKKSQELIDMTSDTEKALYTVHTLKTDDSTFESVKKLDPYFKQAEQVKDINEFIKIIDSNLNLTALDVAGYIEQRVPEIGNFALQKTLYYIYADFLERFGTSLFTSHFKVFDHGPVDTEVYQVKKYFKDQLKQSNAFELKVPFLSKSEEIIKLVDEDITKYSDYYDRVWKKYKGKNSDYNLTHQKGTPWDRAYQRGQNSQILDSDIIKYDQLECR